MTDEELTDLNVLPVWRTIDSAGDVEGCLLWCADPRYCDDVRPGPIGAVQGYIKNGIPRAVGMAGDWNFTHYLIPTPPENVT